MTNENNNSLATSNAVSLFKMNIHNNVCSYRVCACVLLVVVLFDVRMGRRNTKEIQNNPSVQFSRNHSVQKSSRQVGTAVECFFPQMDTVQYYVIV